MHTPEPGRHPPVPTEAITYLEDCNFDFHHRQLAPTPVERVDIVNGAIETYTRALRADPYDPDATLGLARAYDNVQRKGCGEKRSRR